MSKLLALNVVGLSPSHIGEHTPHLKALAEQGEMSAIQGMMPAVTTSVQATYFTGVTPSVHGIVGNGWYFREMAEVKFWHQSNRLVQHPQIWSEWRNRFPGSTTANLFCWYNMYCAADTAITVRPMYPADGRKLPDIYTAPPELRDPIQQELGTFPLFNFWGPNSNITSSRWIADCTLRTLEQQKPDLCVAYLPHLDYPLQKVGPQHESVAQHLQDIDAECGKLINYAKQNDYQVAVFSEYGISEVQRTCHINKLFREKGWIAYREELGRDVLDVGASKVFAVADHQVAHVYIQDESLYAQVYALLEQQDEIDLLFNKAQQETIGLQHARSGDIVAIAKSDAWFSYYYWLDDSKAPDYARTVDIHRKPGYDPVELFIDPALNFPKLSVISKLARKKMGFRTLLDVIPLQTGLVKGSHGAITSPEHGAVFIGSQTGLLDASQKQDGIAPTEVMALLMKLAE